MAGLISASWIGENASAEVSAELLQTTVRAALRFATQRVVMSSISPAILSLTEGAFDHADGAEISCWGGADWRRPRVAGHLLREPGVGWLAGVVVDSDQSGALADQELKARLDESAALAAKLQ